MKTLTYLFWSLKKYHEKVWLTKGQYNWTILVFSLPYNIPIMLFSGAFVQVFINPYLEMEILRIIIFLLFTLLIFFLLAQPLKIFFPKKKIENSIYTRKEVKKYRMNILYFTIGFFVLIALAFVYIRYTK
ncbi:hypothetical protein [Chryseobacterium polytrichastri]|uniref:Uncharacterized protein n=1 Tax=Chryseobacterium polytrichastri TaxID=1302687 RepID=A0A1M7GI25_9FLAO|nr:hypothetical protein [Chryseobacterium polytrichastri]SHM15577.1 hypothetical protein SAMN05444267_103628 [Chryseobacterium polytrichastri]